MRSPLLPSLSLSLSVSLIFFVSSSIAVSIVGPSAESSAEFVHLRTLTSALGSEEKAKDSLVYVYKHAASGFCAKLTPDQVAELSKQPGVLQVLPDRKYRLHTRPGMLHKVTCSV